MPRFNSIVYCRLRTCQRTGDLQVKTLHELNQFYRHYGSAGRFEKRILELHGHGESYDRRFLYLVTELCSTTIRDRRAAAPGERLSPEVSMRLAVQMIDAVRQVRFTCTH